MTQPVFWPLRAYVLLARQKCLATLARSCKSESPLIVPVSRDSAPRPLPEPAASRQCIEEANWATPDSLSGTGPA